VIVRSGALNKKTIRDIDVSGRRVEMEIDPRTGAIAHLERFD